MLRPGLVRGHVRARGRGGRVREVGQAVAVLQCVMEDVVDSEVESVMQVGVGMCGRRLGMCGDVGVCC